jgi:hypothetical protein
VVTPVIPATQEAEIRRIMVGGQPRQIVHKTPLSKILNTKKDWWSGQEVKAPA